MGVVALGQEDGSEMAAGCDEAEKVNQGEMGASITSNSEKGVRFDLIQVKIRWRTSQAAIVRGPRTSGTTTTTKVKILSGKSGGVWNTRQKVMSMFLVMTIMMMMMTMMIVKK